MVLYFFKRILLAVPVLLLVVSIIFFAIQLTGNPVEAMLPLGATEQDVQEFTEQMGLHLPVFERYIHFLGNVARGDFGVSYQQNTSALMLVISRLPATLTLAFVAIFFAVVVAIPLGVVAAIRKDSYYDSIFSLFVLIFQSLPTFYVGILFMLFFSVNLGWLPTYGYGSWKHILLPALTLGTFTVATIMRITRNSMIEVLPEQYMITAESKGLSKVKLYWKHAFKNASIAILTIIGLQLGNMISAAFVTEVVFAWPGIGTLAVNAVTNRDVPVVIASVFVATAFFIIINIIVDMIYAYLDPRIKLKKN